MGSSAQQLVAAKEGGEPDMSLWKTRRRSEEMAQARNLFADIVLFHTPMKVICSELNLQYTKEVEMIDTEEVMKEAQYQIGMCCVTQALTNKLGTGETRDTCVVQAHKYFLDNELTMPKGVGAMLQKSAS